MTAFSKRYLLFFIGSAMGLMFGCHSEKVITEDKAVNKDLSASKRIDYEYILTEATKQKILGNIRQAISLYEKCLEVDNNSDIAYYQIANIMLITGNYDRALPYARKAVILNEDNYWYNIQLAQLYVIKNEKDSATLIYERITEKWPERVEIYYEIARLNAEKGEYDKALKILNKIEKDNGISEPVSMLKEQIYMKTGKEELAINEVKKLVELMPDEIRYLGLLAEIYNESGRNDEARQTYDKLFKIAPGNIQALLSYTEFLRETGETEEQYKILNNIFRDPKVTADEKLQILIGYLTSEKEFNKENEKIGELINILKELYPDNYKVKTANADYLVKNNNYTEALKEYDEVLSVEKSNYFIWEQVLLIENTLGHNDKVYSKSKEALEIFKDKPLLYLFNGNAALEKNSYNEAIIAFGEGLKYTGNNKDIRIQFFSLMAETFRSSGNNESSDSCYEEALKLDPNNLLILNNYSYFLSLRKEKLKMAEQMSLKTIEAEPQNYVYLDTYAWILYNMGNYKKSLEFIEKAMQFNGSDDPDILEHYGDILEQLGRKSEAIKYWKISVDKGNTGESILRKIEMKEKQ